MTKTNDRRTGDFLRLDAREARRFTDEFKKTEAAQDELLLLLYERGAWKALGYPSWRAYCEAEFNWKKSRGYQRLDAAKVRRNLANSTKVENISERQARTMVRLDFDDQREVARRADFKIQTAKEIGHEVDAVRGEPSGRWKPRGPPTPRSRNCSDAPISRT